ncbi:MAG TPA: peptide chain release factor N(5)-glutamine methyltransferase [Panacibacter sp.]|nr:peptide chain release factor N(5)-glutamine methyltransferase [Panacibacter sp.]
MTVQQTYSRLVAQLLELYDEREAVAIADWVIENITGFKKIGRIMNKQFLLNDTQQKKMVHYTEQLLQQKPVQYVLHEAWFAGLKLYVDENVLIPRPETEELIEWVAADCIKSKDIASGCCYSVLDIGTGSGCIAIALRKKIPFAEISAVDISDAALSTAKKNAAEHQTDIRFDQLDILDKASWKQLPVFDIIVSNPPYIKANEILTMKENVLKHEPHIALFVPDEDALIFYTTIAVFGFEHLVNTGKLYFEINELHGADVCAMLSNYGYNHVELRKDFQGKDRMVCAVKG